MSEAKVWETQRFAMCSLVNAPDIIRQRWQECLDFYGATDPTDATMRNLESGPQWDRSVRSQWTIEVYSYCGWKAYQLLSGCFASLTAYEPICRNPANTLYAMRRAVGRWQWTTAERLAVLLSGWLDAGGYLPPGEDRQELRRECQWVTGETARARSIVDGTIAALLGD